MKPTFLFLPILSFVFFSCTELDPNKQVDEGQVTGATYESKEIGWIIEIPKGWKVIAKDKIEASNEKGKKLLEQTAGGEVDISGLKYLISFQKNQFNIFNSTSEPFVEEYPGEYEQNRKFVYGLIHDTYTSQGIKTDTATTTERIQGLDFHVLFTTIYSPEGEKLFNQILFSRLINGYDFAMTITYNNEEDRQTMLDAIKQSKFRDL